MRKFFTLAVLLLAVFCGKAQNIQLHYDFGGALYDKDLDGVLCSATGYANFCDMYWK